MYFHKIVIEGFDSKQKIKVDSFFVSCDEFFFLDSFCF